MQVVDQVVRKKLANGRWASADADIQAASGLPGAIDVRLDSTRTQARLTTRLRGAREFLASTRT